MTDYAIAIMAEMSRGSDAVASAAQLSEQMGLPEPTVAKLLKLLVRGGLLISQRGAGGGYRLARTAEEISISEIVTVLEGPIALTECLDAEKDCCTIHAKCAVRGGWSKVNAALQQSLENISLAEMAG